MPLELATLVAGSINTKANQDHWQVLLRLVMSIKSGTVMAAVILRMLAAEPSPEWSGPCSARTRQARAHFIHPRLVARSRTGPPLSLQGRATKRAAPGGILEPIR